MNNNYIKNNKFKYDSIIMVFFNFFLYIFCVLILLLFNYVSKLFYFLYFGISVLFLFN